MDLCHPDPGELSSSEAEELQQIKWHRKQLLEDIQKLKDEIADVFAQIDCFEIAEESRMAQKEKELCIGRKKFNMDPVKGIQYLTEHKLLSADVQDIAQFLYKGEGLNKTAIGSYLGERDPTNLKVLQAFVDCHEFANLNLVQALRQFLWSFRLPGEAQKIDRMMETFASRYCLCNPGVFQSTDTCYVLSFSIIMLNTSLHNPNVRDRPPFERFVSMNRGINGGSDLPEEQLRNLFDSIKSEPFSIPEDDGNDLTHTFFNPDLEGWLLKLGGRVKTWKRRWFILTDSCLYYFEFTTDKEPRGIIPLENLSVQKVDDPKKPFCLELYNPSCRGQKIKACKTDGDGKVVEGKHESYRISAPSAEERDQWIEAIRVASAQLPTIPPLLALGSRGLPPHAHERFQDELAGDPAGWRPLQQEALAGKSLGLGILEEEAPVGFKQMGAGSSSPTDTHGTDEHSLPSHSCWALAPAQPGNQETPALSSLSGCGTLN
ncbi:cytohesin-4 isoform X2 [Manis javanica]|uniref:cytohesin-4 isoform X2 n=1 Tax=Manis javanica TaxID=9974 RepID=UPI001879645C|nr:cytohesin-4 isoform X2 [Manis javanica]